MSNSLKQINSADHAMRSHLQGTTKNTSQDRGKTSYDPTKPMGADPMSKVSYRQKGKRYTGQLVKGASSAAFFKKSMASVPSAKFDTVVYYNQESAGKKGFGSNSERFGTGHEMHRKVE